MPSGIYHKIGLLLFVLLLLAGCQTAVTLPPTPINMHGNQTAVATPEPTPPLLPTATQPLEEWQQIQPSIEKRLIELHDGEGQLQERLRIIRIDNNDYRFEIAYAPGDPKSIQAWLDELEAVLVVNGSFFTPEFTATGLSVIDGQPRGQSYVGFGGMVVIEDGRLTIQDLVERPYVANESIDFALQTFPMLVKKGGQIGFTDPGNPARRTVIGVDKDGRILLILAEVGAFTLAEMSQWLVNSDLELDIALNLDGGPSSGLAIVGEEAVGLLPIPNVIALYPNE